MTNTIAYSNKKTLTKPAGLGFSTTKVTEGDLVTTDTKDSDSIGTKTDTSSVAKTWSDLTAHINAGFTFFFSPNFLIDTNYASAITHAGDTSDGTGISLTGTNLWDDIIAGTFYVMFTIKK
jgi:hypothetical protein